MKVRLVLASLGGTAAFNATGGPHYPTLSNVSAFVDLDTPASAKTIKSSRGETWTLVMSDEFNRPNRSFKPGADPIWTAIDMPDGVNQALEYYSVNMTTTVKDTDGRGVLRITTQRDNIVTTVYNENKNPPGFDTIRMYYRSGMIQSWNKFCLQGGLVEIMCQLPGITNGAINTDAQSPQARVSSGRVLCLATVFISGNSFCLAKLLLNAKLGTYYPTWPGVWLMGNLGRALFSSSTARMWPWSYNVCDPSLQNDQRISACDGKPGFGMNPHQGRGAPEIDILEGGGTTISSSLQIAPGMPDDFRTKYNASEPTCMYSGTCNMIGANGPDVPSSMTQLRRHKSWYQGLRYGAHKCAAQPTLTQSPAQINQSLKEGIKVNSCNLQVCPASYDVNGDLGPIDGNPANGYWGINSNGMCFPVMNGYNGIFLCDPYSTNPKCGNKLPSPGSTASNRPKMASYTYQMDAISSNWPVEFAAYSGYMKYQLEWVMGSRGYIRWMVDGLPLFEIPATSLENPPQDASQSNPRKLMIEEPMYMILNTALSSTWSTQPPNAGQACYGDWKDPKTNQICDAFPLYLKVDYIRVYQNATNMAVGCDPTTHPTQVWIDGHKSDYENGDNPAVAVDGLATCKSDADCTLPGVIVTGMCVNATCSCSHPTVFGGPRCTTNRAAVSGRLASDGSVDPPFWVVSVLSALAMIGGAAVLYMRREKKSSSARDPDETSHRTQEFDL
ncbi:Aste57867_25528 [Aphanomyces stellatus]|uniref:Aste57867_25528 protein n=1 Tax=Aphanomyces stellatus TaxID=120398 RepID=A0A485LTI8_9STRA|nr:hypothetical protein As57867_025449 [Aphanomyces stellatus]VFU02151.1 Aste57867_25528 [Aphanomyces stellatus]